MNRLGIESLNAGASDLRLTGDQTQRGTYVQRRRAQMAYGGTPGADGRRAYGLGSLFQKAKDKFVDDIIPNEIKENPMATAALLGVGLDQFGIPFTGTPGDRMGQGWIGDIIGGGKEMLSTGAKKVGTTLGIPGADQWFTGGISGMDDAGLDPRWRELLADQASTGKLGNLGTTAVNQLQRIMQGNAPGLLGLGKYGDPITGAIGNQFQQWLGGQQQQQNQLNQQRELQKINWEVPLAAGAFAHEYQKKYLEDQPEFGKDTTGINFQTGAEAMADPNLRFKPEAQYANVAEGGRIGYAGGADYYTNLYSKYAQEMIQAGKTPMPIEDFVAIMKEQEGRAQGGRIGYKGGSGSYSEYAQAMNALGMEPMPIGIFQSLEGIMSVQEMVNMGSPGKAQGGRIGAQEGGLMNLGGMEKDYRQEGGFVPIGGQEKADDVPARLSKNEFVFTADAVRNAGGGDIDAGAEVMENMMNHLEAGGEVSEDSQGLEGARDMFANAQQLEKRII